MAYSKNKRRIIEDSESEDDNNDEKLNIDNSPGLAPEIPNNNIDVLSLTDADKSVMEKCKIFISQTNGKYCATAMEEAISKINAIIQPILKNVDGREDYQKYCIHEDKCKRDNFFARGLYHPSTQEGVFPVSEEVLLLEVSALRNSSKAAKGKAIKTKALSVVFGPWWNYTLCRMLKILPNYKDGPDEELKSYTAVKLFLAMIDFIKEEKDVIKDGCLPKFKHDFGVDWIDCIKRAKLLFNHNSSTLLQNALIEAQKRVQSLGGEFDETKKKRSGIYTSQVRQQQSTRGKSEVVVKSSGQNSATTRDGNREAPRIHIVSNASQDDEWGRVRDGSGPEPPKFTGCWEFRRGALTSKTSFYINGSKDHLFVAHGEGSNEHVGNNYRGGRSYGRGNYGGRGGGRSGGRFSGGRGGARFGGGRLGNGGVGGRGDYYGPPAGI
mmetsp:Transcript_19407/g.36809  ORF Transcript_19407/g.36809 Transcript_19407/m.36809 type:complete len:438 (-) Transcript_19407:146-1459(-)